MSYATNHAAALASVRSRGASIVFTDDTFAGEGTDGIAALSEPLSVLAFGIEEPGGQEEYARLGLTPSEAPRLFVVTDVYGDEPPLGSVALWGGTRWRVRSVAPFRPDGTTLFAYVILSR